MTEEDRPGAVEVVTCPAEWTDDPRRPPVVIAIPNWNRGDLLRECIDSILQLTAYSRYRVCVFEQGSTDGSRDHLRRWGAQVDAILAPENVGYIPANNAIIDRYPAWDVLLLNNDTRVVDPRWLDTLVSTAHSADDIGLVGAKLVYPDGRLQEAGSQLFRNGSARAHGRFENPAAPAFNLRREVDFCSAACLYVKRSVLRACGGFEACYRPCYYEDVDLAFKARAAGYRVVYEPAATVIHKEYGTSGTAFAIDQMQRNRDIFLDRWRDALHGHPLSLWEMPARDGREQILFVGNATAGGAPGRVRRSTELVQALAGSYDVAYVHPDRATAEDRLRLPDDWGVTTFYPGFALAVGSPDIDLAVIAAHNRFRWVVFDSPRTAADWLGVIRTAVSGFRVAIDAALEPAVDGADCAEADVVLAGTEGQRDAIRRQSARMPVAVVPATSGGERRAGALQSTLGRVMALVRGRAPASIADILADRDRHAVASAEGSGGPSRARLIRDVGAQSATEPG